MQAPTFLSRSASSQVSNSAALVAERHAVDAKTKEDVAVYRGAVLANGDLDGPRSTPSLVPRE